ncbi:MAG: class II fructose-bisphosphate aldolase [Bacilli bacterium]
MPFVSSREMQEQARHDGYAVVGFAAYNLETVKAAIDVAESLRAPIMIQTTPSTLAYAGIAYMASMVRIRAERATIPVALHLDHGNSLELVQECIAQGFTSVMIDGSGLPYEENVLLTRSVVNAAHAAGVAVEAELGQIGGVEDDLSVDEALARHVDFVQVQDFVQRTGIDAFAPAVGTAHGMYKTEPTVDLLLLERIGQVIAKPLVLHGASGLPDKIVRTAIQTGVAKINIATELKVQFASALRAYLVSHPEESDIRRYMNEAVNAYKEVVASKIRLAAADCRY